MDEKYKKSTEKLLEDLKANKQNLDQYLCSLTLEEIKKLVNILEAEYNEATELAFRPEFSVNIMASSLDESIKMDLESYIIGKMPWIYLYGQLPFFKNYDTPYYVEALGKYILEKYVLN